MYYQTCYTVLCIQYTTIIVHACRPNIMCRQACISPGRPQHCHFIFTPPPGMKRHGRLHRGRLQHFIFTPQNWQDLGEINQCKRRESLVCKQEKDVNHIFVTYLAVVVECIVLLKKRASLFQTSKLFVAKQ